MNNFFLRDVDNVKVHREVVVDFVANVHIPLFILINELRHSIRPGCRTLSLVEEVITPVVQKPSRNTVFLVDKHEVRRITQTLKRELILRRVSSYVVFDVAI